jgi:hypothetical protein
MMVQGKGITAKWGAGYCFRTIRQRGMTSDRARHTMWNFCAKTILQDLFGQATIAAISGRFRRCSSLVSDYKLGLVFVSSAA